MLVENDRKKEIVSRRDTMLLKTGYQYQFYQHRVPTGRELILLSCFLPTFHPYRDEDNSITVGYRRPTFRQKVAYPINYPINYPIH
jgi:hypothetical protein